MSKKIGYKSLCIFLVLHFVCLILAGCGAEADERGQGSADEGGNSVGPNGRKVLTAVVTWPSRSTLERINAFNEKSRTYFVEIKEYEQEEAGGSNEDLQTRLTLDILSGKGPDLVIWDGAFYSPLIASEKLMENLYDFMEADEDFRRSDYYENILQAFETDGKLYTLPTSFSVETVCGKAEEIGVGRGVTESWEMGEMIQAFAHSPHAEWLTLNHSKELAFFTVCSGCLENFVDWNSGECCFDTPAFVELLEWSDTFPDQLVLAPDFSYHETLRSGKVFWEPVIMASPWNVAGQRIQFGDADILWPGYPVADGEKDLGGGVARPYGECFSICRNSGNQEGAWEFIKTYLTVDAQRETTGIPLLRSVSEERIQEALTPEYRLVDGIKQETGRYTVVAEGEASVELSCITEEDAETYRALVENTYRSYGNDSGIMEIIMEEAGAYFEKGKDAAEVASVIQNRVSIYINEHLK